MKKKRPPESRALNVELSGDLRKRLRLYVAVTDGATIKGVVAAALDEYLRKKNA